ncbi:MAG: DEAD/DEAH box helicase [Opitutales bacterium]|nr:DEAD/DEAH box helicase [Opitutales bacterium]
MNTPVFEIEKSLYAAADAGKRRFVVSAPTGSGKSTGLPVMLLRKFGGRVLVLQPRRVAARMLARSVGALFDMRDDVGWHVRFEKRYGENSKIVFLTEGILARMLLSDPSLEGVSAVVFDEFHERNIYADISLALALRAQRGLRPDLAIAVCSASMDSSALFEYLGGDSECAAFSCSSRMYGLDISYAPPRSRDSAVWDCAREQFERLARSSDSGNFLIFMPGAYEISRTVGCILRSPASKGFDVLALHGDLPPGEQDKVLAPGTRRKVIVSTNVAETSLTIEGVRFVIDSGLARVARYDPARGVNTLLVERVSLASAAQRAGRAGRTAPGTVVRLWRQSDEASFERFTASEISRLDLSQIVLWLKASGMSADGVGLFEPPPAESLARAARTLANLGALDAMSRITPLGRKMAAFPTQPRYARMLIEGMRRGCLREAALIASLSDCGRIKLPIENAFAAAARDELVGDAASEPEEIARLCELARENSFDEKFCREFGIHSANARKACRAAADLERLALRACRGEAPAREPEPDAAAKCVLCAFSEHVGARLNKGTLACALAAGAKGEICRESRMYADDLFVALDLQERRGGAQGVSIMASMITPIKAEYLREMFPGDFSSDIVVRFDERQKRVACVELVKFRDFIVSENAGAEPPKDAAARILVEKIFENPAILKSFDDSAKAFIERVNFVAAVCPESGIAPIDAAALREIFLQMCWGSNSISQVKNLDALSALRDWLSPEQQAFLKYAAPKSVEISPRRRPAAIRYDASARRAVISASFKDLFSFNPKSVSICGGKIAPTFEILAPNGRPVQTTSNLEEFWKTSWAEVRKELKARYPKHFKPDSPYLFGE